MSSSSTSSINKTSFKYDVFLSFRGEDTRTNFVDHLYQALKLENIETYKDDKNLEKGKKIRKELIKAIEESRFHVIIFSKNYASSSWCLDELVKIIECQKTMSEHTIYPIFYNVEPTHVRKLSGAFGKAFAKHGNHEAAEKWREALLEATSFSGRDLRTTADKHEAEFIKLVVKEISMKLPSISSDKSLIGIRTRINLVVSSLNTFRDEVCMIGIRGMGGSGKTTLARAVFDQICNEFDGCSFVENVRESSNSLVIGLKSLQQQVLRDVLKRQDIIVNGVFDGKKMMKKNMAGRKVLLVLDDVDHIDQLKALAGEPNWFKSGSRIIITTRDNQVLVAHRVNLIHDVNLLTDEEAICLLSRCAFGAESPIQGYEELSQQVVSYAAGLPLTITILGSSLCDANKHVWIDTLEELEKIPLGGTLQKLELSYIGLDTNCKEIFLDVACILKGWNEDKAIKVLESRGFHAIRGLNVLKGKSLITTSRGCLDMHDHIEEMGRYIVRRLHPDEPNKHSRLWIHKEIEDILANNWGTEATKCIYLCLSSHINLEALMRGLGNMEKLRFLFVRHRYFNSNWELDEISQYFPNSLQYLEWESYPFSSLPKTFQASNLVALEMHESAIVHLWEGEERKVLDKLRFLRLRHSKLRTLDLGLTLTPNLEMLDLDGCEGLVELHMPFGCPKLKSLKLSFSKLRTLHLRLTPNLKTLNLEGCNDLVELRILDECTQLEFLDLMLSKLRTLDLGLTPKLKTLKLERCYNLVELRMHDECRELKTLSLRYCPQLMTTFDLGQTPNLEALTLDGHDHLVELLFSVGCPKLKFLEFINSMFRTLELTLSLKTLILENCDLAELHIPDGDVKLEYLDIRRCSNLRTLELTMNLKKLILENCDLVELHIPNGDVKLESVDIRRCPLLTTFELTFNLKKLSLEKCDLLELYIPNGDVKLESLDIRRCSKLKTLELTLNLKKLILEDCDLVEFHIPDGDVKLESLDIRGCSKLKTLELTLNLKKLILENCDLVELHIPDGDVKLESLDIRRCSKLKTLDLGRTPNLESLHLQVFSHFVKLHAPVGGLTKLINLFNSHGFLRFIHFDFLGHVGPLPSLVLTAESVDICPLHPDNNLPKFQFRGFYRDEDLPSSLGNIENLILVGLSCACTGVQSFFESICGLQHLRKLDLSLLPEAPMNLHRLQCLEELSLHSTHFKRLPDGICMLKHLKILKLEYNKLLETLPEDLGRLEYLEILNLQECIVLRDIPNSICRMKRLKYLSLYNCKTVEELPQELRRLKCLEELNIQGTRIRHLRRSILSMKKGMCIVGSRKLLVQLCGLTSKIHTTEYETCCYI